MFSVSDFFFLQMFNLTLKKYAPHPFPPLRDYDREQFAENPVPLLLIGTKFDQIPENKRNEVLTRTAFLSEDFNAEEINLVGQHTLNGKIKNYILQNSSKSRLSFKLKESPQDFRYR